MNNRSLSILACNAITVFALAACQPQTDPPPAQKAAPATTDEATGLATPVEPAVAAFDVKAFPGTFSGTLPCADCPGIDTVLAIEADGSYSLSETYRDRDDAPFVTSGHWSVNDDQAGLLLDPNSKSEDDRHFAIVSMDEVRMLDREGNPIQSELDYGLRREPADL